MKKLLYMCVLLFSLQERGVFCFRSLTFPPSSPTPQPLKYWLIPGWRKYGITPHTSDNDLRIILDQITAFKRGVYCPYKNWYVCQNPQNSDNIIKKIVRLVIGPKPNMLQGMKVYKQEKMQAHISACRAE